MLQNVNCYFSRQNDQRTADTLATKLDDARNLFRMALRNDERSRGLRLHIQLAFCTRYEMLFPVFLVDNDAIVDRKRLMYEGVRDETFNSIVTHVSNN